MSGITSRETTNFSFLMLTIFLILRGLFSLIDIAGGYGETRRITNLNRIQFKTLQHLIQRSMVTIVWCLLSLYLETLLFYHQSTPEILTFYHKYSDFCYQLYFFINVGLEVRAILRSWFIEKNDRWIEQTIQQSLNFVPFFYIQHPLGRVTVFKLLVVLRTAIFYGEIHAYLHELQ